LPISARCTKTDPNAKAERAVYRTGCAGRITQFRETDDGRIELLLSGVCRFDLGDELSTTRGIDSSCRTGRVSLMITLITKIDCRANVNDC